MNLAATATVILSSGFSKRPLMSSGSFLSHSSRGPIHREMPPGAPAASQTWRVLAPSRKSKERDGRRGKENLKTLVNTLWT
jgi:hypothetical protein